MPPPDHLLASKDARGVEFASTHWSVVLAAGDGESPRAAEALNELCRSYWYPLYAYVRRQGLSSHEAQDLTQEFLLRLLRKRDLARVAPEKGRFRSFLLVALKHFLINEWEKERAAKRGSGQQAVAFDDFDPEQRYRLEPRDDLSADKIYERKWALTVLEQVLNRLKRELADAGKAGQFERLKTFLTADETNPPIIDVANQLEVSTGALRVTVHRLRTRYRELLRAEIARTVASPTEVEEELLHLFRVLSG